MKNRRMFGGVACLTLLLVFPLLFPNPAVTSVAVFTLIAAGAATAWNIFSGYTGYISLGYAAFYGLGAYALAVVCGVWHVPGGFGPFLLLPVVGGLTGLCAIPLGWIALKTKRLTFMVITIAIYAVTSQLPNLLTGLSTNMGELSLPIPLWSGDTFNLPFYYTALAVLLLALATSWWVRASKYGLSLLALRDDEERTWGLGIDTRPYKLSAFVISAIFAGMCGAINAYFLGFISPTSAFDRAFNIAIPLMAFLGGVGTLVGPIIGALLAVPMQQYLTIQFGEQGWDLILYGVLFLLILQLLPRGILPTLQKFWTSLANTRESEKGRVYELASEEFAMPPSSSVRSATPIPLAPVRSSVTPIPPVPVTPAVVSLPITPTFVSQPVMPAASIPISRGKMTSGTFEERLKAIRRTSTLTAPGQETADTYDETQKRPAIAVRAPRPAPPTIDTASVPSTPPVQNLSEHSTRFKAIPRPSGESNPDAAMTQRMRATRLVSLPAQQRQQRLAAPTSAQHQHPSPSSTRSRQTRPLAPRCPQCQETLSIWDATYFCTCCGLTLSPPR